MQPRGGWPRIEPTPLHISADFGGVPSARACGGSAALLERKPFAPARWSEHGAVARSPGGPGWRNRVLDAARISALNRGEAVSTGQRTCQNHTTDQEVAGSNPA